MKNNIIKILIIFVHFFILGCSSLKTTQIKPQAQSPSDEGVKAFSKIQRKKEKLDAKIEKLHQFIKKNKNNDLALRAYLYMAKLYLKSGQKDKACKTYYQAIKLPFTYKKQSRVIYAAAKCLKSSNKIKKALSLLESHLHIPQETRANKRVTVLLQWNLIEKRTDLKEWKLKVLTSLIHFNQKSKRLKSYKKQALDLLQTFDFSDLTQLAKKASLYRSFEDRILFLTAQKSWDERNFSKAKSYFEKALSVTSNPLIEKKAQHYLKAITLRGEVNSKRIGVILPLSGKRKSLGQKILRGLHMGLDLGKNSPYQLIIMDSKSHPDIAKNVTEKLFKTQHVIGIVGGLSGETAEAIAEAADNLGIPSILLSQKSGLTANREFIFQNSITSKIISKNLTNTLFKKTNMKNFVILYPNDSYGKEYKESFTQEISNQGGTIIASEGYNPKETDFKDSIKKLIRIYSLKNREEEYENLKKEYLKKNPNLRSRAKKLRPDNLLKPIINFDGIFVPDSTRAVQKIVAHLKYFGIKKMNLIGTNLWKESSVRKWPKDFSFFFLNTPSLSSKEKISSPSYIAYRTQFRSTPSFFERTAYNTGVALKMALEEGAKTRKDLQRNLKNIKNAKGMFFPFKIAEDRGFSYPLTVYSSKEGKAFALDSIPVN